jgi:hypothetical protein
LLVSQPRGAKTSNGVGDGTTVGTIKLGVGIGVLVGATIVGVGAGIVGVAVLVAVGCGVGVYVSSHVGVGVGVQFSKEPLPNSAEATLKNKKALTIKNLIAIDLTLPSKSHFDAERNMAFSPVQGLSY